jgi:hypothetical protein
MASSRRAFLAMLGGAGAVLLPSLNPLIERVFAQSAPTGGAMVSLKAGLAVIQVQYNSTGHLSAVLTPPATQPGQTAVSLFERDGPFKASAALIAGAGNYYAQITAPQPCELLFQQPVPETVAATQQTTLSGRGKDVSTYFTLPSSIQALSVQTSSTRLQAWLYHLDDAGGEAIQGGAGGPGSRFFDLAASGAATSYPVTLPDSGPYLIAVENVLPNDAWSFLFS